MRKDKHRSGGKERTWTRLRRRHAAIEPRLGRTTNAITPPQARSTDLYHQTRRRGGASRELAGVT